MLKRNGGIMPSREENKKQVERHIYDTAITLFCEIGYKKTTLIDIAQEAQVSTRTLYRYFPTKESILRKFGKENILLLKAFASDLPTSMPIKEKVIETMLYDFKLMFCEMDVSYILHSARDDESAYARFEVENVMTTESIYCNLFKKEQLRCGIQPNDLVAVAASVVMGIYRHCTDLWRFRNKGVYDKKELKEFYLMHLDAIWDSLMQALLSDQPKIRLDAGSRQLFAVASD